MLLRKREMSYPQNMATHKEEKKGHRNDLFFKPDRNKVFAQIENFVHETEIYDL